MADSKVQDLTKRVFSNLTDLVGVRLWSGKGAEPNALGLEVPDLLSSQAVVSGTDYDYKALTPKGFSESIMTTVENGVGRFATDLEVDGKSGIGLLISAHQEQMQNQWGKDWFVHNAIVSDPPPISYVNAADAGMYSIVFTATFRAVGLAPEIEYFFNPVLPVGKTFKNVYISIAANSSSEIASITRPLVYTGGTIRASIGASTMYIGISADGRNVFFNKAGGSGVDTYDVAATVHAIIE